MQNHNDDTIKTRSLEKYTSHFIERVVCERELETEQNCNILTPTLMAISVSFPFFWAAQPGAWGPASLGAGFLYRILSPTCLIPNWLNFLCTELYNSSTSTFFLWASQFHTHSTCPRSRLWYPDIPWPDAPVIYTGAFWQPGRVVGQYTTPFVNYKDSKIINPTLNPA